MRGVERGGEGGEGECEDREGERDIDGGEGRVERERGRGRAGLEE